MSNTPKTDEAAGFHPGETVPADFCRQLEIELNNYKEIAEELAEVANLAPNSYQSEYGIECRLKETLVKYSKLRNVSTY